MTDNKDSTPQVDPNRAMNLAYPANNKKSKEGAEKAKAKPEKFDSVIEGVATKQKQSVGKRIRLAFTGDDARSVGDYLIFEVALPAIKTTLSDLVSQGVERMLFGGNSRTPGSGNRRPGNVNYNMISRNQVNTGREEPRVLSQRDKATHSFDNIVLGSRDDAEKVLSSLIDIIENYDMAAVSDFYELVNITGSFADDKWGWFELHGADITRVRDGWILDLPPTKPLR